MSSHNTRRMENRFPDIPIEMQMLNALEYFHYSSRFQDHLFVLILEKSIDFYDLITDLRILHAARIRLVMISWDDPALVDGVSQWQQRGCPFRYLPWKNEGQESGKTVEEIRNSLEAREIPVIGYSENELQGSAGGEVLDRFGLNLSMNFRVDKVFFLSQQEGLYVDDAFMSHLTPQEADKLLQSRRSINIGIERLSFFLEFNRQTGFEMVLLRGVRGALFQEIFTHKGRGTLLTNDYPNIIRNGRISDVMDISLLIRPYVESGLILPVDEDRIAADVDHYYVYTVNNSIVAIAKLTDHGEAMELAKFCTLPRYQGKGRARELAEKMIETVKQARKSYMFALSVEPRMFDFFKSLGFKECDRRTLPKSWRENYNWLRSSRAFKLEVS